MAKPSEMPRYPALDGWRGISILLVLAAHLVPIGPKDWQLNEAVARLGMAIFFTLSGFLIVNMLLRDDSIGAFLIRRASRIVPLAWLYCAVVLILQGSDSSTYLAHYFFYANLPPFWVTPPTGHLWSLCVEMQFYVGVALIVLVLGRRGLLLLPLLALGVTALRVSTSTHASIVTWLRIDEILAGGTLALICNGELGDGPRKLLQRARWWMLLPLVLLGSWVQGEAFQYGRPYAVAAMVGITLVGTHEKLAQWLNTRWLVYLARISYALYVIHIGLLVTWLDEGEKIARYLKRPLLLVILFGSAHLSTFLFESRCITLGRALAERWKARKQVLSS